MSANGGRGRALDEIESRLSDAERARSNQVSDIGEWSVENVKLRLVDAAELIERITARAGPSNRITFWIDAQLFRGVTDFERNAMAEGVRSGTREPDRYRRSASSEAIAAAENALEWPMRYICDDNERRILAFWIFCNLRNAPFGRLCPKIAGSKNTAYRRLNRAYEVILAGLKKDGVKP